MGSIKSTKAPKHRAWVRLLASGCLAAGLLALQGCSLFPVAEPAVTPTPIAPISPWDGVQLPSSEDMVEDVPTVLYYPNADRSQLVRQVVDIRRGPDTWIPEAAVRKLLEVPENSTELSSVFRGRGELTSLNKSRNLVTVDVEVDATLLTEEEVFTGVVALVNTITETARVEYVSVLLNGQTVANRGILISPMEKQTQSLEVLWLMHQAALNPQTRPSMGIQQRMTSPLVLFFKDVSGTYLLPEVQSRRNPADNSAAEVLLALLRGPGNSAQLSSVLRNMTMTPGPTIETEEDGVTRYVNVSLASSRSDLQDPNAMRLACGAITLSLTYNIPDIRYVKISLDGKPITTFSGVSLSEDGTFTGLQFADTIGDLAELYFPNRSGKALVSVTRAMGQEDVRLAESRVAELLIGPRSSDSSGVTYAFPLTVSEDDLLNGYVSGSCAYVSFSKAFAEACKHISPQEERMMVYSIVNTLTSMENIHQVQFLVEDRGIASLGGTLDLSAPLWRDPGLIQP